MGDPGGGAGDGGRGLPELDLLVFGATPGGIACAVRAAREGLRVALVSSRPHLGGMLAAGIGVMDTQLDGRRAPLYDEVCDRIKEHYRATYGADSEPYRTCLPGPRDRSSNRLTFEPHVGERVLTDMVRGESRITVLAPYVPVAVERAGRLLRAVRLRAAGGGETIRLAAQAFADGSYEADLAALAGVPYRVGRESRGEYGEPHAGRIFTVRHNTPGGAGAYPRAARDGALNLRPFVAISQEVFAGSTGEGDDRVQAYHYRLCVTRDPANRRLPQRPATYDPGFFRAWFGQDLPRIGGSGIPNGKQNWWVNFSGHSDAYPRASPEQRAEIERRFRDFSLGVLYFLQHDESVPQAVQAEAREWGLAADEFVDHENVPYELYVREARRIVGRYVFTEHDASLAPGLERTPVHADSIATTDWFMDSHEVSRERQTGSAQEGTFLLSEKTRPAQVPYRCLLPEDVDNLLVPVALSATHVGWGTLRLEPVWMHTGESAGLAAALAARHRTHPGALPAERLLRTLVERRVQVTFFNDLDAATDRPWVPAVQYFGTKGFFPSYDALPEAPLAAGPAGAWVHTWSGLLPGESTSPARGLPGRPGGDAGTSPERPVAGRDLAALLRAAAPASAREGTGRIEAAFGRHGVSLDGPVSRGDACRVLYSLLPELAP